MGGVGAGKVFSTIWPTPMVKISKKKHGFKHSQPKSKFFMVEIWLNLKILPRNLTTVIPILTLTMAEM